MSRLVSRNRIGVLVLAGFVALASPASAKELIEYFQPTPIVNTLTSGTWGASGTLPRDINNGLEDTTNQQCYWDGKIIKANDGKYHMFGSRWAESMGHDGWLNSVAVHAVSNSPLGPYVYQGLAYTNQSGKGHNVTADVLPDGRYVIVVSETRPGDVFISSSLDGPWTFQGSITVDANGYGTTGTTSNVSLVVRPDGNFLMVSRHGILMLSTTGILGPYKVQGPSVYPTIAGLNNGNAEDPVIWYSGGQYHITVNWWDARKAYHLTSTDGIRNWRNMGLAYDPLRDFIRYTNGTVNRWNKIERPGVLIENGHVTHFTFAVVDVAKEQELGNDNHGSKVIVVPFDGVLFDAETGVGGAGTGGAGGTGAGGRGGGAGGGAAGGAGQGGRGGAGGGAAGGGRGGTAGGAATGGRVGAGGAVATGGTTGVAGTTGTAGSGGGIVSGGSGGASGVAGSSGVGSGGIGAAAGGADGQTGGSPGGGGTGNSMVAGTGGSSAPGTGGMSTGPTGTGGGPATGGRSGTGVNDGATPAGCACVVGPGSAGSPAISLIAMAVGLFLTLGRRRGCPRRRGPDQRRP